MSERLNEYTKVERPFIDQLESMGWSYIEGDTDDPAITERETFRQILLKQRLRAALRRINLDPSGEPWLDGSRVGEAVSRLERLGHGGLLEVNEEATRLLLKGTTVEGNPEVDLGREEAVRFIDWRHLERNDFLAVNQFRVDPPGNRPYIVPDLVLFVNGIPLVVVECKSPNITDPMEAGIDQLRRYTNQREWVEEAEGAERLFHYNQFLVSTWFYEARAATIGAGAEHYQEWKDTSPVPMAEIAEEVGTSELKSQHVLAAGMLRPAHLLDIVRNFTLFMQAGPKRIKIIPRYQQFRAVHQALHRLRTGETRREDGTQDRRGGIVWHTQGSGKSLTMVFLIRKMRTLPDLRRFKIVAITDRTDLKEQLRETARLTGEPIRTAATTDELKQLLREPGAGLIFAMIQLYQERDTEDETAEITYREGAYTQPQTSRLAADESAGGRPAEERVLRLSDRDEDFETLNTSEDILVLVDEAHRSHSSALHANLMRALPNCAKIGFTGTPILMGEQKRTHEIFGPFIDRYTIEQSERDGSTVPILYEGRTADARVADERGLDRLFEDMFRDRTAEEIEAIKHKYATRGNVLEAPKMIEAKARDMLRHFVDTVLPNGLKAQLVAYSRLATVRYQKALEEAHRELVAEVEALHPAVLELSNEELREQDERTRFLARAHRRLDVLRGLEFAAVISRATNDPADWHTWSDKGRQTARIARFKKPLLHENPAKRDGLAFLCVRTMLLTGFDAPAEQVLYLDRGMHGHELLQAIARVNRRHTGKSHGLVVDYYGVGRHLSEALSVYADEDVAGALTDVSEELPRLRDRHERVLQIFREQGIGTITDVDACVDLLRDMRVRARFTVALKDFLESLDTVLPRPEALPYTRDAKILGFINKTAENLYRDSQLNISGAKHKVRELIDDYIEAQGVDPRVPPISIMDAAFEDAVDHHASARAKASEMEHAARHHIRTHLHEDPAYYRSLSERLEEILKRFEDDWEQLVVALREFTGDVREGRQEDETGLDPHTQAPFMGVLKEAVTNGERELPDEEAQELAEHTIDMVGHIAREIRIVDFWSNTHAQEVLRSWLVRFLDDREIVPFGEQEKVAGELMEVAKANHHRLSE